MSYELSPWERTQIISFNIRGNLGIKIVDKSHATTQSRKMASTGTGSTTALKILIVGNSNTGKSCLTLRFVEETFSQNFVPTIGIDFHVKTLDIEGYVTFALVKAENLLQLEISRKVKLQIWDTAGQERFHNVTRTYFRGAAAVLLVYDICDRESFDWLVKWRDQVVEYTGELFLMSFSND